MPKVFLKDINPVRGAAFRDMEFDDDLVRNYDIFDLPDGMVPSRDQLKEIWFTYSLVSNFLLNPALTTGSEVRLENGVRWLRAVQQAYPRDAVMAASLYFLEWRRHLLPATDLEKLRSEATSKLAQSAYWQQRNQAFGFACLLDRELPSVDPRCTAFLATPTGSEMSK